MIAFPARFLYNVSSENLLFFQIIERLESELEGFDRFVTERAEAEAERK